MKLIQQKAACAHTIEPPAPRQSSKSSTEPAVECDSTATMEVTPRSAAERAGLGLKNEVGERNCFINVVIQSMWHLRSFRDGFLALQEGGEPGQEMGIKEGANEGAKEGTEGKEGNPEEGKGTEGKGTVEEKADSTSQQVLSALKGVFAEYQKVEKGEGKGEGEPGLVEPASLREAMAMTSEEEMQMGDFADAAEAHMTLLELLGDTAAAPLVEKVFGMKLEETKCSPAEGDEPLQYITNVHYVSA